MDTVSEQPEASMRLSEIQVTKLFGVFNHTINLRTADRITIIHGPNGYGKTAILQMVQALLTNQTSVFRRVPFESFRVRFDSGAQLEVTKRLKKNGKDEAHVSLHYHFHHKEKRLDHSIEFGARPRLPFSPDFIDRHIEELERVGPEHWLHVPTGRRLDIDDVIDLYGDFLPGAIRRDSRKLPEWLSQLPKKFDVRVIEAQRLMSVADKRRTHRADYSYEPAVASYSRELAARIQQKTAQYGTVSQQLDSTFPTRVLQKKVSSHTTVSQLTAKLQELEEKRQRVIDAGLLAKKSYPAPIGSTEPS